MTRRPPLIPLLIALLLGLVAARPVAAQSPPVAPTLDPSPPGEVPRFSWPLSAPRPILRPFQAPSSPYGPGHRGVDLAGKPGAPVLSAADGVVVFAGPVAGRGVVSVDHPGGLRTTYEPVEPQVATGQQVTRGTVIGLLSPGHPGCTGACLHWGVRRGAEYFDPVGLLSGGRVRLLPWSDP